MTEPEKVKRESEVSSGGRFYIIGGTLPRNAPSYVMRRADQDLYIGLTQGQFCYVLTSRQMGKSSLMVRTAVRLREEGVAVVVLDLTAIGQNLTAEQWYDGLLSRIGQQLDLEQELEDFWLSHGRLAPLQRWTRAIQEVVLSRHAGHVMIFIDEIDAVRSLPFSTDEFFAAIREFYNRRTEDPELNRLTFCLLGVATPSDLIRDTRTTPFNIGERIELNDFSEAEAAPLAKGLRREGKLGAMLLKRILYWTGGHPYLTQRLCQAVAEEASISDPEGVDRLCEGLFLSHRAQERDDNLLFVRERMLRSEADLASLLDLYKQVHKGKRVPDDDTNPFVSILRLSGVTRVEGGCLKVRNRIYAQVFDRAWITASMPEAELRRQRAAYRRGVLRTTAISAVILAVMAILVLFAIREARRADQNSRAASLSTQQAQKASAEAELRRQQATQQQGVAEQQRQQAVQQQTIAEEQRARAEQQELSNRRLLYAAHLNLAYQAWESEGIERVLELLEAQRPKPGQEDLRGFEWNYLWRLCHSNLFTLQHKGMVNTVAFSPDGKRLATVSGNRTVKLWDTATGQELVTLSKHQGAIATVLFSPDGKRLAVANQGIISSRYLRDRISNIIGIQRTSNPSEDNTVRLWDVSTGQEIATLTGHTDGINSMAFSPDGKRLATASVDSTVKLWNAITGRESATLTGHKGEVSSVLFSPDGQRPATGGSPAYIPRDNKTIKNEDNAVKLWDVATGREISTLTGHTGGINSMAFSPDGKRLATASADSTVKLWDVITGRELASLTGHEGKVSSVLFSSDGLRLVTGGSVTYNLTRDSFEFIVSADGVVRLWDAATGQNIATLAGHKGRILCVAFSPDGKRLATGSFDRTVKLWDAATGHELTTLKGHKAEVASVVFSPDGRRLATGSWDQTVRLWDVVTRPELATLTEQVKQDHTSAITSVAFSPDGRRLATGGGDGTIKVWDVITRHNLTTHKKDAEWIFSVAVSPDGKRLAVGAGILKLWDMVTGREVALLKEDASRVFSVAFSPDGKRLATGGIGRTTIRLWDMTTGHELAALNGHTSWVNSVAFSPDGKRLASGSEDGTVRLWDVAKREALTTLRGHTGGVTSLAFSPDGKTLVTGGKDNTVRLWDLATGHGLTTLKGHTGRVNSVVFSPDGKRLATAGVDNTVRLWDVVTGHELVTLRGHTSQVASVAFSPDGKSLATGSFDGTVKLWPAAIDK